MRYLILAVLGIAILLAACSGSDDSQQQRVTQSAQTASQGSDTSQSADSSEPTEQRSQQPARQQESAAEQPQQQAEQRTTTKTRSDSQEEQQQEEQTAAAQRPRQTEDSNDEAQEQAQQSTPQSEQQAESEQSQDDAGSGDDAADQPAQSQPEPEQQQAEPMQPEEDEQHQAQAEPEQDQGPSDTERLRLRAAEIAADATVTDLTGIVRWLNGEETSIALELAKGNVVLIDFWTYTCINCIRTLPFLTEWHDKYADYGLVIIGVHTPEFEFEKDPDNIRAAIDQYGIQYRVPQDDDYRTWRAFNNRFWPAKYLIGPTMDVRYLHFGEGDYDHTEVAIREALIDAGRDVSHIPFGTTAAEPQKDPVRGRQTRELYGGTHRNYGRVQYAAQGEYYLQADAEIFYQDIDTSREQREHNKWYLQGLWRNEREAIVHARETQNLEDYLAFDFQARTVNVVITVAEDGRPFNVYIEMDGRWLTPDDAGEHIQWDEQGRSYIRVTVNDLYRLVNLPVWSKHELKLRSNSDQLQIFAFTFGSYLGGE